LVEEDASSGPRPPDFVGIGTQKAGTTWLHRWLRRHPQVWVPLLKEVHYFDQVHLPGSAGRAPIVRRRAVARRARWLETRPEGDPEAEDVRAFAADEVDDDWYRSRFALARRDQVCGEITPSYCLLPPEGIEHALRLKPELRAIFLMRDPIERTWAGARLRMRLDQVDGARVGRDFEAFCLQSQNLQRVDYPAILERWSGLLGEARIRGWFLDDIRERPLSILREGCEFLGVDGDEAHFSGVEEAVNSDPAMEMPETLYARLREELEPIYREMAERYPEPCGRWLRRHYG